MFVKHKELYKHFREKHTKGKNPAPSIASRSKGLQQSKSRKDGYSHETRRPSVTGQGPSNVSLEDNVVRDEREEPFPDMNEDTSYARQLEPPVNPQTRCRQALDIQQAKSHWLIVVAALNRGPVLPAPASYSIPYNGNSATIPFSQQPLHGNCKSK